jgi:hypothetical protein
VNGTLSCTASGSILREGLTDASGTVTFAGIPKVAYHLVLVPPNDLAGATITTGNIDLGSVGANDSRTISLAKKVTVNGTLLPANSAGGATLVATDTGSDVLMNVISTLVGSDGTYSFAAAPGRTYRFSVEPAPGKNLPMRIPLYGVQTTEQDTNLAPRTLPAGLHVSGTVTYTNFDNNLRFPVAGAIVQAYCQQSGMPGCRDPENPGPTLPPPVVEVSTTSSGTYSFYLPDPKSPG